MTKTVTTIVITKTEGSDWLPSIRLTYDPVKFFEVMGLVESARALMRASILQGCPKATVSSEPNVSRETSPRASRNPRVSKGAKPSGKDKAK